MNDVGVVVVVVGGRSSGATDDTIANVSIVFSMCYMWWVC